MNVSIGRKFNGWTLFQFALPTIIMMVFMSMYTIVDGMFVSQYVGTDALSAINIVYPLLSVVTAISIMLGHGGSAIIARKLGEGKLKDAREDLSLLTAFGFIISVIFCAICLLFHRPIIQLLGASPTLYAYCKDYLIAVIAFGPAAMLQMLFGVFFVTSGVPNLGCFLTILAGFANILFDYLFIVVFDMGIQGAAFGTATSYFIPTIAGIYYFSRKKSMLHFCKFPIQLKVLKEACFNGSSEMVTHLSSAFITLFFNLLMMHYLGEKGVAAITIVLYSHFLFTALYLGFSEGVAPVISFQYGAKDYKELRKIYHICMKFLIGSSAVIFLASLLSANWVVAVFSAPKTETFEIAVHGFRLFAATYLFTAVNIYASAIFTALSDGKTSAIISFLRTFGFLILGLIILPFWLQVDGIWIATPFAELMTLFVSIHYLKRLPF